MRMLSRYVLKEFVSFFISSMIGILSVYLCVDFLQKADDFIKHKASIVTVLTYFLYTIPSIVTPSIPIAALLATLLSLGNLSRHNEIIAMRSSGISFGKIISPVLVAGVVISAAGFINNEMVMPDYSARANRIRNVEIEKKPEIVFFKQRKLWIRGPENSIVNINFISPNREEMFGINIYKLNPDFTLRERIKADKLLWQDGAWRLRDGLKFSLAKNGVRSLPVDGEIFNVVENPNNLRMIVRPPEEMTFAELWDYVRRLKTTGYYMPRLEVDLYAKLAFPFAALLMVMIAAPLSLHRVRSGGAGWSIAFAVLIAFVYWALMSIGTALGRSGTIPPLPAAWLANILFTVSSVFILARMNRQN